MVAFYVMATTVSAGRQLFEEFEQFGKKAGSGRSTRDPGSRFAPSPTTSPFRQPAPLR